MVHAGSSRTACSSTDSPDGAHYFLHFILSPGSPMFSFEPMMPADIFSLDIANLDENSENFTFDYYLNYILDHPAYFITIRSLNPIFAPTEYSGAAPLSTLCGSPVLGYIFGKLELNDGLSLHISGLTVSPALRKHGFGTALLNLFVDTGDCSGARFCDLYVRKNNSTAIEFYKGNGFVHYRHVLDYYSEPDEDACDMRKPMASDPQHRSLLAGYDIHASLLYNSG